MDFMSHGFADPDLASASDAVWRRSTEKPRSSGGIEDARDFRRALGSFATGITIVTARAPDGGLAGVTANSFCSVSLEPPLVLWCLSASAPSRAVFAHASHFAVHILAEDQLGLSDRFCRPSRNKFAGLEVTEGLGGAPLLDGVVALFECRREQRHDAGDHIILVGRVERYQHTDRRPLVFHGSNYHGLGQP
jgi:flavin reductase (DIM6/NTAB) family NADH-FMN oxidoreductase RutF